MKPECTHIEKPVPPIILTIAGFDPSNGAGITADLQVFAAHGLFGISAITALTVQSTRGVAGVEPVSSETLRKTLEHLAEDMPIAGVKIGMLGSRAAVVEVTAFLKSSLGTDGRTSEIPVVLDPVLRASSGAELLEEQGMSALPELLQMVSWVTPNWGELAVLSGCAVESVEDAKSAATALANRYPTLHVVATGGDIAGEPVDIWRSPNGVFQALHGERVETTSTHGTGCAFSSALLSGLVLGQSAGEAVRDAKGFVEAALKCAPGVGTGRGPLGLLQTMRP